MQDKSKGNKNLMEYVEEHMKEDVIVRCKVFESHNSKEFKDMNKEFKKTVHTYWNDDRYLED